MMRIGKRFGRKALAVAACTLAACLCAGAAFAGNLENSAVFAESVNDVPAPAANAAPVAESAGGAGSSGDSAGADDGVVLNKTAKANSDGSYTITLEAYATGEQTTVSHYDPVDIVLVLDTSGSMYAGMQDSDFEVVYSSGVSIDPDSYYDCYRKYWVIEDGEFVNACVINTRNVKENNATPQWRTQKNWNTNGSTFYPKTGSNDNEGNHRQFYVVKNSASRMDSLKASVNSFVSNVFTASPESSVAIVPFGTNVGAVTGFTSNRETLSNAVAALTPGGATDSGAAMAKAAELLGNDTVKNDGREKVVVMFTDGAPCSTGNTFDNSIADAAILNGNTLKENGATVYTVGVFSGADSAVPSNASSNENKYMHYVSSNYPEASSMMNPGALSGNLDGKSYYLTAANASELQNVFKLISEDVGGATNTALGSSTVVKDVIAPSFTVPAGASDIKLYTADCTGAGLAFDRRVEAAGVDATFDGDTLNVTGFDFSQNWCGDHSGTYDGKKLIIEFTVSPKPGFLGGNDVPTNGAESGIYVAGECIDKFQVPTVNVPIGDVVVSAFDKNVYLTQVPGDSALKADMIATCGDVDITDPSKLEDWQKAYVDITGPTVTLPADFDATDDATYTATATVSPKTDGSTTAEGAPVTAETDSATGNINVFKPELTFKDSEVWYGDDAPTDYSDNKTIEAWKHEGTLSTAVGMTGGKPELDLTYAPEFDKVVGGKIASKDDVAVGVKVEIGVADVTGETAFKHADCAGKTCSVPSGKEFLLHVKTCSLTIEKAAASGTAIGDDEYFVFDVKKDGEAYTQVVVRGTGSVTISELPVGAYTVFEDSSTAWRYASSFEKDSVTLSKDKASATVVCENTAENDKWINCFSRAINVFDAKPAAEANE